MSWRIHNGFMLSNITTLDDTYDYCIKISEKFQKISESIWAELVISHAILEFDRSKYLNIPLHKSPMSNALNIMCDFENDSIKRKTKTFTNRGMQLNFAPVMIQRKQYIVGIAFIDDEIMQEKFLEDPEIMDFSYWDNADKPEELSIKSWNMRKKVWANLFSNNKFRPADYMMSFEIVPNGPAFPKYEEFFTICCQSFENRVDSLAKDVCYSKIVGTDFW